MFKAIIKLSLFYSMQDYDIQQKIDLEIKMREGTTKLLAACKREAQTLEAAKNLLTSDARVLAYMAELQKRKSEEYSCKRSTENGGKGSSIPCKGKVSVSGELTWTDNWWESSMCYLTITIGNNSPRAQYNNCLMQKCVQPKQKYPHPQLLIFRGGTSA